MLKRKLEIKNNWSKTKFFYVYTKHKSFIILASALGTKNFS